jgi:hypothetical protein
LETTVMKLRHRPFAAAAAAAAGVRAGDERPGRIAADMVFIIDEKAHPRFK